jgi:L-arabinose transport system substrate-binding protein
MRNTFVSVLSVFILSVIFTGCGKQSAEPGAESSSKKKIKIGFLVKQAEEPWFQVEWKFAAQAGAEHGFEVVQLAIPDAEKTLTAIDNLAAAGAAGFVICTPDVKLGPAILNKAKANGLKVMSVDDQFVGSDGKIMEEVHHLGVAARDVGHVSGQSLWDEFKKRGWPIEETAAGIVTFEELDTSRERTEGIIERLVEMGFPAEQIHKTPEKTTDIPGSFDAMNILLTKHPSIKYWLVAGMNDSASLGAVRALEGIGFTAENAIGVGINGTDCIGELQKEKPTPFYGSILMEANVHGYDTALAMYKWVSEGVEPRKAVFTGGMLITRDNFEEELKRHGMWTE